MGPVVWLGGTTGPLGFTAQCREELHRKWCVLGYGLRQLGVVTKEHGEASRAGAERWAGKPWACPVSSDLSKPFVWGTPGSPQNQESTVQEPMTLERCLLKTHTATFETRSVVQRPGVWEPGLSTRSQVFMWRTVIANLFWNCLFL